MLVVDVRRSARERRALKGEDSEAALLQPLRRLFDDAEVGVFLDVESSPW